MYADEMVWPNLDGLGSPDGRGMMCA